MTPTKDGYVATYKGKRASEMTRDELIEAVEYLTRELAHERKFSRTALAMEQLFHAAAR